jgi:hypothetical protein
MSLIVVVIESDLILLLLDHQRNRDVGILVGKFESRLLGYLGVILWIYKLRVDSLIEVVAVWCLQAVHQLVL